MNYKDLLKDERWQAKRQQILERDKHTCQWCGAKEHLEVHHMNYDAPTPWEVPNMFLVTLCHDCHNYRHNGLFTLPFKKECDWSHFCLDKRGFTVHGNFAEYRNDEWVIFVINRGAMETASLFIYKLPQKGKCYYENHDICGEIDLEDCIFDVTGITL